VLVATEKPTSAVDASEETLTGALNRLLLDPSTCDAHLVFGDERAACHSLVLRARSPVVARMLKPNAGRHSVILNTRVATKQIVDAFLRFLYTDALDAALPDDVLMGLMAMAAELEVAPLKRASECTLQAEVAVPNAAKILVLATDLKAEDLRKTAMDFVVEYTNAVMETVGFEKLAKERPELLCDILREKSKK
jgi:hypothetical protein